MNIKKLIISTTSLLITATILSQLYSLTQERLKERNLNLEAFVNFKENILSLSKISSEEKFSSEDTKVTDEIIALIGKEIRSKIGHSKYLISLSVHKEKNQTIALEKIELQKPNQSFEINNNELVSLSGFQTEEVSYNKFANTKLASTYNEVIKDEVVIAQASTSETIMHADEVNVIQPAVSKEEKAANDEMVMFDYSSKETSTAGTNEVTKKLDKSLYERPMSETVKNVINRELHKETINKTVVMSTQKKEEKNIIDESNEENNSTENNIIYEYGENKISDKTNKAQQTIAAVGAFIAEPQTEKGNKLFTIVAKEVNLNTHKIKKAMSFEFVPDYERSDRIDDAGTGAINLGYPLNANMNTQTGVIQSRGIITTRVELNLGSENGVEVPLITEEGIQNFLKSKGLEVEGNLILLRVDSAVVDTEINTKFDNVFYFNTKFQLLDDGKGAEYVMYAGVKSGNIMIRYLLSNKESAEKIVYVGDGELYFENAKFNMSKRETFTLMTRNLLGQKKKELNINSNNVNYFNTQIMANKKALNAYELKIPTTPIGMRKYIELKHLKDTIILGTENEKEIEIPSNDFIAKVLENNEVNSLKEKCVVQLNLTKDVRQLTVNGKNKSGEMFVETSYIDKDGNFSRESELAEKAFIVGDMEGLFNARLEYTDGSTEFLKTFCADGTYLVEQL